MEKKAREIELEILDKHHKQFELLKYNDEQTIPYLLKAFGDIERNIDDLRNLGYSEYSIKMFLISIINGISHCVRWVNDSTGNALKPIPEIEVWNNNIMDFVTWGRDYYGVAQQYVVWSRGLCHIEVDEGKKQILFLPAEEKNYYFVIQQQHALYEYGKDIYDTLPMQDLSNIFKQWYKEIGIHPIPFPIAGSIDWNKALDSVLYPIVYKSAEEIILPELDGLIDLGGYTINDFRQFYTILYINFSFISWIEELMDETMGEENPYGSNPIDFPQKEMIRFLSNITKLNQEKVQNIVNDFTFDSSNFHSSLFLQPIVQSKNNRIYLLPNLIVRLDPNRMLIGTLNKGEKRKIYDTLINKIERFHLDKLHQNFSKNKSWLTITDKKITVNKKTIYPDMLLIDKSSKTVLIVDYKHFIVPISASEVDYKLKEIRKGIKQIEGYIDFFKNHFLSIENQSIDGHYQIYGLLLFHQPTPVPIDTGENLYITDMLSLNRIISDNGNIDVTSLLKKLNTHEPEGLRNDDFSLIDVEVKVGDWTFVRKVYASDTPHPKQ